MMQRVTRVNRYWLDHIWGPIGEGNVNQGDSIWMVPMTEDRNVVRLVEDYLRRYFDRLPTSVHLRLKATWRYALNACDDRTLERALDNLLPPFATPRDTRHFYAECWRLLFHEESWEIADLSAYADLGAPLLSPWQRQLPQAAGATAAAAERKIRRRRPAAPRPQRRRQR